MPWTGGVFFPRRGAPVGPACAEGDPTGFWAKTTEGPPRLLRAKGPRLWGAVYFGRGILGVEPRLQTPRRRAALWVCIKFAAEGR